MHGPEGLGHGGTGGAAVGPADRPGGSQDDLIRDAENLAIRVEASRQGRLGSGRRTTSHVRELRLSKGWTQVELSAYASVNHNVVKKAEKGWLLKLRIDTLMKLANALDCGAADLFPVLGSRLDR